MRAKRSAVISDRRCSLQIGADWCAAEGERPNSVNRNSYCLKALVLEIRWNLIARCAKDNGMKTNKDQMQMLFKKSMLKADM